VEKNRRTLKAIRDDSAVQIPKIPHSFGIGRSAIAMAEIAVGEK